MMACFCKVYCKLPRRPPNMSLCLLMKFRVFYKSNPLGLPSLVPLCAFATDIFPKLQADISERVNLLRFAKLAPTFYNRARPASRRFVYRLCHGAFAFLAIWLRTRLLRVAWASSVTSSLSAATSFPRRGLSHRRPTLIPHPLFSTLPHYL
jgi:hypothetical protein